MDAGSGLLATLGRPARQSACECERSSDIRLGSVMALLSGPTVSGAINDSTNALAKMAEAEKDDHKLVDDVFLRVLNRPATPSEINHVLALLNSVGTDYTKITNELTALELKMAPAIEELKHQREDAISRAKANLDTYDENTKFLRAELDKHRQAEIAAVQRELKDYEKLLPAQAAFWESKNNLADTKTTWMLVQPEDVSVNGDNKLTRQPDGSILASGSKGEADYLVLAHSPLGNITGVMLEVLPDDTLPKFGPGRNRDGEFVLTEFQLNWGEGTNGPAAAAKFSDARADYSQKSFPVKQAIDGRIESGRNGWGVDGAAGVQRHAATFKLDRPLVTTNGVTLRFTLVQHFGDERLVGRFRLYLTGNDDPLDLGLPERVAQAVRSPAGQRTPDQAAAIVEYYRASDVEFWKHKQAVVQASEPVPTDPKLTELKKALSKAEEPIRLDPYLVQLREAAEAGGKQATNKRLTVVQDLAWALINTPAFLFNH
jgi:hypothetical protein